MKYTIPTSALLSVLGTTCASDTTIPKLRGATSLFEGIANEYKQTQSAEEAVAASCNAPQRFSPNQMYDLSTSASTLSYCKDTSKLDMWNLESALFRLISAQSSRIYQGERLWCDGDWDSNAQDGDGMPYRMDDYVVHVISLLDTIQQLQMLPQECIDLHKPLRELLLPGRDTSDYPEEYEVDFTRQEPPSLSFWEDEFLPTLAAAFSCGFTDDDTNEDIDTLPSDIKDYFQDNITVQQVWRLTKGYIKSPQKQREFLHRQTDFDVSLYVPFLPVAKSRVYLGEAARDDGTVGGTLRNGFPTYQGPAVWYLWHSVSTYTSFDSSLEILILYPIIHLNCLILFIPHSS